MTIVRLIHKLMNSTEKGSQYFLGFSTFILFKGLFISRWSEAALPARNVWKAAASKLSYFSSNVLSSGG